MENEMRSIAKVAIIVFASMAYARFASANLRPGVPRLTFLLPVLLLVVFLPFSFSSIQLRGTSAFFLSWLSLFKLLLLSFDRGPLHPSLPLLSFLSIASLPIKLLQSTPVPKPSSHTFLLSTAIRALLLALVISLYRFRNQMNGYLLLGLYGIHIYLALELILASVKAIVVGLLRMELEQQFNKPYYSSSLRDFWGRRWNLMVSAVLRPSVYGPVKSRWGAHAGIIATFLVSGLMHELMFYYITLRGPTGEVTAFFLLHGTCCAAEQWWVKRRDRSWRPPAALVPLLTVGFVAVTGFWLFFPPLVRGGTDEMIFEEYMTLMVFLERTGREMLRLTSLV